MMICLAYNIVNNAKCKFLAYPNSEYCGMHKNKEHHEKCLEIKKNRGAVYYEKNKIMLAEKHKQYYNENIDKFKQRILCSCKSSILRTDYIRHSKTKKHAKKHANNS